LASEIYPNLSFDDLEANKEFLREIGLPEVFAGDKNKM